MKLQPNQTTKVPRMLALAASALSVALPMALAQDASAPAEPTKLEKVVVTGSLIPTAETVGVAPVETITPVQIQESGQQDVLQVIKRLSTSFSGNGNIGQTVNNGGAGEANVALRNLPTLVLLDGRRMANSSFSNGSAVDLNALPLSMIERIEVLKDGASTIYGADAIGGVINIITKKNYNGAEISGRYGFATGQGSVAEQTASLVAGTSNEKTSVVAGGSWYHMDPLLTKDRAPGNLTAEQKYNAGFDPTLSGSFPARVDSSLFVGSPLMADDPRYRPNLASPPIVPGGPFNSLAAYNAAAAALGYTNYVTLSSLPIAARSHTTAFYYYPEFTYSIQKQNRDQAWVNFNHEIEGKKLELFGQFLYAHTVSQAQLAPSPVANPQTSGITIPANNIYNPFGIALGVNGAGRPVVRTRFLDFGPRMFEYTKDYFHFVGGLKGEITDRWSWQAEYNYNRSDELTRTMNAVNGASLNKALTPDLAADPTGHLSLLKNFVGDRLPVYNIFAPPGHNDPETVNAIRTTLYNSGVSDLWNVNGIINGQPVDLPAGPLSVAAGFQYVNESLMVDFDGLLKAGLVPGLNPADALPKKTRERWAGLAEVRVPITSTEKNITGFYSFELNASGRYETLNPGGDAWVPKVGFRWQPLDEQITVRGTFSQGFIAPSIYTLYAPPTVSYPQIVMPTTPGGANDTEQEQVQYLSNPSLPPSTSDNFTIGLVYSPKQITNLTFSVEYYNIDEKQVGYNPDPNVMVADLNARGPASQWEQYYRKADGTRLTAADIGTLSHADFGVLKIPTVGGPSGGQRTDGLDFSVNYVLETETAGKYTFFCNATYLLSYDMKTGPNDPYYSYAGMYTDNAVLGAGNGALPRFAVTPGVSIEYQNFTYTVMARYIPNVDDPGDMHPIAGGNPVNGYTVNGEPWVIDDWFSIDMQLAYEFKSEGKWYNGTRLAIGCNNITDEQAPIIASSFEDNTDKSTYDILGRFVYFELSKKF